MLTSFDRVVAHVSAPPDALASAEDGLPPGPARAEAVAVRLRRAGAELEWGPPVAERSWLRLLRAARSRGGSSVEVMRTDPSLVSELQIGGWFDATWRRRGARRVLVRLGPLIGLLRVLRSRRSFELALDAAFWQGVRRVASGREWARLTRSSYVALVYHRLAGDGKPGQANLDLAPEQFARQLRLLRLLRFRLLSHDEVERFHSDPQATLPPRSVAITVDDGFLDCVPPLKAHVAAKPQLFVPTREVGGEAWWADGEPVAGWDDLAELAGSGLSVGSHSRRHVPLPELSDAELDAELLGSLADIRDALGPHATESLAYPHGRHDLRVRAVAARAGYRLAWTTAVGRNGAGTDRLSLRRVGPKARDGRAAFLWKAFIGELLPRRWEARQLAR